MIIKLRDNYITLKSFMLSLQTLSAAKRFEEHESLSKLTNLIEFFSWFKDVRDGIIMC